MSAGAMTVDVSALIDRQSIGTFHISAATLCGLLLVADGFDVQAIGYVAPEIIREWGVDRVALTPVFSAGLFGLMLGALIMGPAADRFGRKTVIIACAAFFGICTLLTTLAHSVETLTILRFITGLGLGGAMPNAIALLTEYAPRRNRATMVTIMVCGFSIGAALGGVLAAWLVPHFGWKSVFYVGGVIPLLLIPFMVKWVPESIRLLVLRGRSSAEIVRVLSRLDPTHGASANAVFVVHEAEPKGFRVGHLFTEGRALATTLLWIAFFMNLVGLYFITNWLPTVISDAGIPVAQAVIATAMFQVGGTVGAVVLGNLTDRVGSFRVLPASFTLAAIFIALIGAVGISIELITAMAFMAGFGVVGSQVAMNALAGAFYPTFIRSTGVGWALGIGRFGSIFGPILGFALLARQLPLSTLFLVAAVPSCCAAIAIYVMGRLDMTNASAPGGR